MNNKQIFTFMCGHFLATIWTKNKGADQPVHPLRLISPYVIHSLNSTIYKVATCIITILLLVSITE